MPMRGSAPPGTATVPVMGLRPGERGGTRGLPEPRQMSKNALRLALVQIRLGSVSAAPVPRMLEDARRPAQLHRSSAYRSRVLGGSPLLCSFPCIFLLLVTYATAW